jgi:hypothetical protein
LVNKINLSTYHHLEPHFYEKSPPSQEKYIDILKYFFNLPAKANYNLKWIRGGKWREEIKFVKIGSEGGKIFAFLPLYIRLIVFGEIRGQDMGMGVYWPVLAGIPNCR